jgi:hypothetical protein
MDNSEKFINLYRNNIHREGADKLLEFLVSSNSDFFTAPASTKFHCSHVHGLVEHSINVYECLKDYISRPRVENVYGMHYSDETIAIVALLHDLCKINCYSVYHKNVKDDSGKWCQVDAYSYDDPLPYGHGEKSVYLVSGFMKLTREEAFSIRYHMGFSGSEDPRNVGSALKLFPLALALFVADMEATNLVDDQSKASETTVFH